MRAIATMLMALVLGACAQPPTTGPTPTGSPTAALQSAAPSIASPPGASPPGTSPSGVDASLAGLLPASVNGAATSTATFGVFDRRAPRVFLKVVARLDKTPPDGRVALAFNADATIYAVRVDGIDGSQILQTFLVERLGAAGASAAPTVDIGGKSVIKFGASGGTFVHASGETFFYVEGKDEATAADVLKQLP